MTAPYLPHAPLACRCGHVSAAHNVPRRAQSIEHACDHCGCMAFAPDLAITAGQQVARGVRVVVLLAVLGALLGWLVSVA